MTREGASGRFWLAATTPRERRTLIAACVGYGLDAFDFMLYTFVIPTLLVAWHLSKGEAGYIATGALVSSAVGGWVAGVLADRYGRVRVLQWTVAWFAAFACLSGFTSSFAQLFATRVLQGLGFGGEWAVGAVLIAETVEARHRGKAAGVVQSSWALGWGTAALAYWGVYSLAAPELAWRILFWLGVLPALLIVYIRRGVDESPEYSRMRASGQEARPLGIFAQPLLPTTLLASVLSTGMMGAYYAVGIWLPSYLRTERHLSVVGTSGYLLVMIAGSFAGYLSSAWLNDALGRRVCFILFALCGGLMITLYTLVPVSDAQTLWLGFPLGFFQSGIFSGMGAFLSELYPSPMRGSGQGFAYSAGRALGALFPAAVGMWSEHVALGTAFGLLTAAGYALVIVAAALLPETRGRVLGPVAER
jgi:MFS family permease